MNNNESQTLQRETMEVDILIVGGGPAGLSAACKLAQLAKDQKQTMSICVLEKGSEIGAHLLSGAVLEPSAFYELFPEYQDKGLPIGVAVKEDKVYYCLSKNKSVPVPLALCPSTLHNKGNYIVSIGELCKWLAQRAEELGVDILPSFPADKIIYENDKVVGVITADMGLDSNNQQRDNFTPGIELRAKYTLLAEGAKGHLGDELINKYQLDKGVAPPKYSIGIKEIWEVPKAQHQPGKVVHTVGWPLTRHGAEGGGFIYHAHNQQVWVGLITGLGYANPYINPFEEFQSYKHHPQVKRYLEKAKRIAYGARLISKGGWHSLPRMDFPGGLLLGCNAGTLNFAKIKGIHMAMKSGMIAAEVVMKSLSKINNSDKAATAGTSLSNYQAAFKASWAGQELYRGRNVNYIQKKYGVLLGGARNFIEINILRGKSLVNLYDTKPDHALTEIASKHKEIDYPKPDGVLSFDRNSSVFLSNTNHEENQPCHLQLQDAKIPIEKNEPLYKEPAQRYCPAGVYEILNDAQNKPYFHINAQNCVHCKTCVVKDPAQNIRWVPPEGGGGPNYTAM